MYCVQVVVRVDRTMRHCTTVSSISGDGWMLSWQTCDECFLTVIHSTSLKPHSIT